MLGLTYMLFPREVGGIRLPLSPKDEKVSYIGDDYFNWAADKTSKEEEEEEEEDDDIYISIEDVPLVEFSLIETGILFLTLIFTKRFQVLDFFIYSYFELLLLLPAFALSILWYINLTYISKSVFTQFMYITTGLTFQYYLIIIFNRFIIDVNHGFIIICFINFVYAVHDIIRYIYKKRWIKKGTNSNKATEYSNTFCLAFVSCYIGWEILLFKLAHHIILTNEEYLMSYLFPLTILFVIELLDEEYEDNDSFEYCNEIMLV
ncbi:uncharacterized protein RJT21DRAFT_28226 [Scheffersomyces amazonensis]|uniref:uncharacterized protein n=1 Tax=Scheffersomyces amazonensis TaxID=1078765 RepID=UPI00315C7038